MNVELEFSQEYYKKHDSRRINIEKGFLSSKEVKEYCIILDIDETKFGYRKAAVQLVNPNIRLLMESWETQINKFLKGQGIPPIKILYGNKIYPKIKKIDDPARTSFYYLKLKSIWINHKAKPFPQLWLE